jgi:hypothetical protein
MRLVFASVLSLTLGLVVAGCRGSGGETSGIAIIVAASPSVVAPNSAAVPPSGPQATAPQANATPSGTEIFDIAFTGAMQGAWRTGDRSAGVICTVFGNNQLNVAMFGTLNNANFGLTVHQDSFSPNAFTFPMTAGPTAPWVQITSPTDAKLQWDLNGPKGKGSLTVAGNATTQVGGSIDADLADKNGGAAVHVRGSFTCRIGGR